MAAEKLARDDATAARKLRGEQDAEKAKSDAASAELGKVAAKEADAAQKQVRDEKAREEAVATHQAAEKEERKKKHHERRQKEAEK